MGGPNRHRSHAFAHKPTAGMTCPLEPAPLGTPTLDWVGRVGHGRHGGGASAKCDGPLMSALNFWSFSFKRKGQEKY
jgi:hypothetical protein